MKTKDGMSHFHTGQYDDAHQDYGRYMECEDIRRAIENGQYNGVDAVLHHVRVRGAVCLAEATKVLGSLPSSAEGDEKPSDWETLKVSLEEGREPYSWEQDTIRFAITVAIAVGTGYFYKGSMPSPGQIFIGSMIACLTVIFGQHVDRLFPGARS